MAFGKTTFYSYFRRRQLKSPVKLAHIWVPLLFLVVCLLRNQNVASLSFAEAAVGVGISVLSFLPLFIWASRNEREPPGFQCFCAVHFSYYAYPILSTDSSYMAYPETSRLTAGCCVLLFLALVNLIYHLGRKSGGAKGPASILEYRFLPDQSIKVLFTLMLITWLVFLVVRNFGLIRLGVGANTLNSLATGAGTVAIWTLARANGRTKTDSGPFNLHRRDDDRRVDNLLCHRQPHLRPDDADRCGDRVHARPGQGALDADSRVTGNRYVSESRQAGNA